MFATYGTYDQGETAAHPDNSKYAIRSRNIQDHEGNGVDIVWSPRSWHDESHDNPPPFPYQVYRLTTVTNVTTSSEFSLAFASSILSINGVPNTSCNYHFQVYEKAFPNVLGCIAHQLREIQHRNRNAISPRLLQNWSHRETYTGANYQGKIIVIDKDDWLNTGITFVNFDPIELERSSYPALWHVAEGDFDKVQALRSRSIRSIQEHLTQWWEGAGGKWTEAELARRNDGGASPVLYPAVDPAAHFDAEHEEASELDGSALAGSASSLLGDDEESAIRIVDTFDSEELFKGEGELTAFRTEFYGDSFGLPVTSVWNSRKSSTRPIFR